MRRSFHFTRAREDGGLTDFSTSTLRLALSQCAPRLGDVACNAAQLSSIARANSADILVPPELSLTGYDVRDRVHELACTPE